MVRAKAAGNSEKIPYTRVSQADIIRGKPYKVHKTGSATGKTTGEVVEVAASVIIPSKGPIYNMIVVKPASGFRSKGPSAFAKAGDSGAGIYNEKDQLIGLVWGVDTGTSLTYACHIHPVLDYLKVTPITKC